VRIDLCLSRLCLMKTRSQAEKACDEGLVQWNGHRARPAREVRVGDRIVFQDRLGRWIREVEIVELPERSVTKAAARSCYRMLRDERTEGPWPGEEPVDPV
jgi:ribosome-associated heat shock protein Hsp15